MEKGLRKEIKFSILRRLTGRQKPSKNRIIASIVIVIVVLILTFLVGFYFNQFLTKPSANVVFHPYTGDNESIHIQITNGPKKLTDVSLKVKTCHMNDFEYIPVPDLIEYETYPVSLNDKETAYALKKIFQKVVCDPMNTSTNPECWIKTYIINGTAYAPPQKFNKYRCGYCKYTLILKSNEFSKNITDFFFSPIEVNTYSLDITPETVLDVNEEEMEFFSPIAIRLFSPYDVCMLETDGKYERCKDQPIIPVIQKPITMSISPTNKSLGNITITIKQNT
ncbi:MAG: hypothetical protein GF416_00255 [Candidatus Altiarchaeales archaeon]|nr:hypothetical protein [Candidatus Altiarchaeales archaeon]MBD3415553.1 hypothetical protein [Candidatus Altiarchaeales archaeon]